LLSTRQRVRVCSGLGRLPPGIDTPLAALEPARLQLARVSLVQAGGVVGVDTGAIRGPGRACL